MTKPTPDEVLSAYDGTYKQRSDLENKYDYVSTGEMLADALRQAVDEIERLEKVLIEIRDGWRHASDCDVSFGRPEDECDCYHVVAANAVGFKKVP